jgi:hypothetical protein
MLRKVRRADISKGDRDLFERYGESVIARVVSSINSPQEELARIVTNPGARDAARDWLTERGDEDEWRSQRDFLLEIAIIVLIGIEIALGVVGLIEGNQQAKLMTAMNANIAGTTTALETLQETQRNALQALQLSTQELTSKPDIQFSVLRTDSVLTVKARNSGPLKSAQSVTCDFYIWNLDKPIGSSFQLERGSTRMGDLAPEQTTTLNLVGYRTIPPLAYVPKDRVLVNLAASCSACQERAYWALLTLGVMDGHYVETKAIDPSTLSADQLSRKAVELKSQKGLQVIPFSAN